MASVGEEEGAIPLLDNGLPGVERLNVRTISAAIAAVRSGACYGWLPEDRILDLLAAKELVPLRMYSGSTMRITLCLLKPETDPLGPTASHMAEIVQEHSRRYAESL
jgi:DNA-binding transcriptional LysR family regulator